MYFTPENAGRIDYFRWQIEEWKINDFLRRKKCPPSCIATTTGGANPSPTVKKQQCPFLRVGDKTLKSTQAVVDR